MSSILKGLNESYFNRDEQDQQNAMDTRRRSDLSGERNAGLNEPDELPTSSAETRNGVYEYSVPTGQEKIAQELGLQLHKGHWFSRVPVQRANFQFGRPQFHEIPAKNVSEAEQDYGPEYQDKVKRLGQMAKQGERKTVWDPIKRVYKTVPVNPPKEQGVAEGPEFDKWANDRAASQLHKLKPATLWEVSFDYGPHQTDSVKVKARSAQEAVDKVETAAEKKGRSIMVNWAKPAEQGIAEGVAETMTMDDAMKVLKHYGAGHFKTTSNELYFYKNGKPFSVDLIWNDDANRSVNLSQLNSITRQLKGQGVAEDQRLDPSCWKGYKKQGTKMKGDTRVNNCVPKESAIMKGLVDENRQGDK
jgi:hypothetical protein